MRKMEDSDREMSNVEYLELERLAREKYDMDKHDFEQLKREFRGCVYYNVEGFIGHYFRGRSWSKETTETKSFYGPRPDETFFSRRPDWETKKECVDSYLKAIKDVLPTDGRHAYHASSDTCMAAGAEGRRGWRCGWRCGCTMDLFMTHESVRADAEGRYRYEDVRVVGHVKWSDSKDDGDETDGEDVEEEDTFLRLAQSVRNVFACQPLRTFVHAFILDGTRMRPLVFDRAGAYGPPSFDIEREPDLFALVIGGYGMMSDEELGYNQAVRFEGKDMYVEVKRTKYWLDPVPFVQQDEVVCEGTTCFGASRSKGGERDVVVKMAWADVQAEDEDYLIAWTKENGAKNVLDVVAFERCLWKEQPYTVGTMRGDIGFPWLDIASSTSTGKSRDTVRVRRQTTTTESNSRKRPKCCEIWQDVARRMAKRMARRMASASARAVSGIEGPCVERPCFDLVLTVLVSSSDVRPLESYASLSELSRVFGDISVAVLTLTTRFHTNAMHSEAIFCNPS